jgi:heme-degrading monooxygenase HmoA
MHAIVWRYDIKPGAEAEFLAAYGPEGDWAHLFGQAEGFLGTELYRSTGEPHRFLTVDRWRAETDFEAFKARFGGEYAAMDRRFEDLTVDEARLGTLDA